MSRKVRCGISALLAVAFFSLSGAPAAVAANTAASVGEPSRQMGVIADELPYLVRVYSRTIASEEAGMTSTGTGFLYKDQNGQWGIITNAHVVGGAAASDVWIRFGDMPQAYKTVVRGKDPVADVALIEAPSPLPGHALPATLGDSSKVSVGDEVYAVGYPYNIRSVAHGYVNALEAPFAVGTKAYFSFTSQAPMLPGNSGGPLLKMEPGDVQSIIGINTSISPIGLMSFSIKINEVKKLMPRLWRENVVLHASAGAIFLDTGMINPFLYEKTTGVAYPPRRHGVLVVAVRSGGAADAAGIRAGDMVTGIQYSGVDIPIDNAQKLHDFIFFDLRVGEVVTFKTIRSDQEITRTVTLEELMPPVRATVPEVP